MLNYFSGASVYSDGFCLNKARTSTHMKIENSRTWPQLIGYVV